MEELKAYLKQIEVAAADIEKACGRAEIGIVLGSGLGDYVNALENPVCLSYSDISGFPQSTAPGHAGKWWCGTLHGKRVYMMQGRFHCYEGYDLRTVTLPIRVMKMLGVQTLILTNASGGVNLSFKSGDLMLMTDYINLSGKNPLTGPTDQALGDRFPDMGHAFCKPLQELALCAAKEKGIDLKQGVYAWMNGPSYESPAEIRMVRAIGGDAVGMSTVPEVIVANQMHLNTLGISCITNMAAGVLDQPLTHKEVMETGLRVAGTFRALVDAIVEKL